MEFDKSRVYTAINADELKVGSKVFVADTMYVLQIKVRDEVFLENLVKIQSEECEHRFGIDGSNWALAYLVEPSEEKVLKWTDLKVGDVIRKKDRKISKLIIGINEESSSDLHVCVGCMLIKDKDLKEWEKVEK